MKLVASKISTGHILSDRVNGAKNRGVICSLSGLSYDTGLKYRQHRVEYKKLKCELWGIKSCFFTDSSRLSRRDVSSTHVVSCITCSGETKECTRKSEDAMRISRDQIENAGTGSNSEWNSTQVESKPRNSAVHLTDACNFLHNDAKFVNERAKNDIVLLSRGIIMLDNRARQDVAVLGNEFLKLDARARKDKEKIDNSMKKKAARLQHIATILKNRAHSKLKTVADEHWSDGALEADLRRADVMVKRRAMEDAYMALKFVKDIHDMMANKHIPKNEGSLPVGDLMDYINLERNGKTSDQFPGAISTDRIAAIQQAYWSMASALSEADGIDYTDPEELELLVATLIDLDAMDGKGGISLLAECSCSPDVNTRKALANALAAAPSMWTLGNAGMGALQRLANDSNPAIAAAASKAIEELRRQWEIQEGDSFTFVVNQSSPSKDADNFSLNEDSP